jgi:hypothetical protein
VQPAPGLDEQRVEAPHLRLLEGRNAATELGPGSLGAWILTFGTLCASGGHGLFLFCAVTRLSKVPSLAELGGPLHAAVVAWFFAAIPLALLVLAMRRPFLRLGVRRAWSLGSTSGALTLLAYLVYLRAIALA